MNAPLLVFAGLVLAAAVAVVTAILAVSSPAAGPCRAGVSSVGPAVIRDGRLVAVAKPHTEACLP